MLFCLLSAMLGLTDQETLRRVAAGWRRSAAGSPKDELIRIAGLDAATVATVEAALEKHLAAHGGDVEAAVRALDTMAPVDGTLSLVGWWAQQCLLTQPTPAMTAGHQRDE